MKIGTANMTLDTSSTTSNTSLISSSPYSAAQYSNSNYSCASSTSSTSSLSSLSNSPTSSSSSFDHDHDTKSKLDVIIRPLRRNDVPQVCELHKETLCVSYPPSFYLNLLFASTAHCLVAVLASCPTQVVGCLSWSSSDPRAVQVLGDDENNSDASDDEDEVVEEEHEEEEEIEQDEHYVYTLCVRPHYRRLGVGSLLLSTFCKKVLLCPTKRLVSIKLHVQPSNMSARALYDRHHFTVDALERNHYSKSSLHGPGPLLDRDALRMVLHSCT